MDELVKAEFERMTDENIRQNHRICALETKVEQLNEIMIAIKELTINMAHMVEKQDEMKSDLDEIKAAPAQKWDKLVWAVCAAIVAGVIGYILKSVGL